MKRCSPIFAMREIQIKTTVRGMPGWLSQLDIRLLNLAQLMVVRLSPTLDSALSVEPAWDSLSLPLPLSPACALFL